MGFRMRFLSCLSLLALLLAVNPAFAQSESPTPPGTSTPSKPIQQKFATTMCHDRVLCPGAAGNLDFKYADVANKCIREDFSLNSVSGTGFFESYGMDANNCLLVKSDAIQRNPDRINIIPQCCIVPTPGNSSCSLHCELVTAP